MGVEPEPETLALAERIRKGAVDWSLLQGMVEEFRLASVVSDEPAPPLVTQLAPFLGLRAELEQVAADWLDRHCRLLTLLGPGGVGKSRLAQQVIAEQAQCFADGARWVSLTAVEANPLVATMLQTLHVPTHGTANLKDQLLAFLTKKELLLVLDNFEHLVAEAGFAGSIVAVCPRVKPLVTSRARLALAVKWAISLDGLGIPPAPAVGYLGSGWCRQRGTGAGIRDL